MPRKSPYRTVCCWSAALLLLSGCSTTQSNAGFFASLDRAATIQSPPYEEAAIDPQVEEKPASGIPREPTIIDPSPDLKPHSGIQAREQSNRQVKIVALPPDADPAYSTPVGLDEDVDATQATKRIIDDPTGQAVGTVTSTRNSVSFTSQ